MRADNLARDCNTLEPAPKPKWQRWVEANLDDILDRMKSGRYFAPPVRRHYIPKADGTKRHLGIPTFEDKVAQRAILMLLDPIYEVDFLPCSYGFRPKRSAHDALDALRKGIIEQRQRWVIDADLKSCFDSISHTHLRSFLDLRIKDGVVRRMLAQAFHPSLTFAPACLHGTGGGGTENQGVAEVIARYRLKLDRYMHSGRSACETCRVRASLYTCTCASPTKSAPTAPC